MSAIPPLPALAEIATITCTTTNGKVSCVDASGEPVLGSRLKDLQSILKPIADAPTLADAKQVAAKDVSVKAPEALKTVEAKPVSDTPAPPKEAKLAAASTPTPETKSAVVADTKPAALVAKPALSDATIPEAKPAVVAEPKPAAEPKASVVTESQPAPQVRVPHTLVE